MESHTQSDIPPKTIYCICLSDSLFDQWLRKFSNQWCTFSKNLLIKKGFLTCAVVVFDTTGAAILYETKLQLRITVISTTITPAVHDSRLLNTFILFEIIFFLYGWFIVKILNKYSTDSDLKKKNRKNVLITELEENKKVSYISNIVSNTHTNLLIIFFFIQSKNGNPLNCVFIKLKWTILDHKDKTHSQRRKQTFKFDFYRYFFGSASVRLPPIVRTKTLQKILSDIRIHLLIKLNLILFNHFKWNTRCHILCNSHLQYNYLFTFKKNKNH